MCEVSSSARRLGQQPFQHQQRLQRQQRRAERHEYELQRRWPCWYLRSDLGQGVRRCRGVHSAAGDDLAALQHDQTLLQRELR